MAIDGGHGGSGSAAVTVFICANCARPAQSPGSAGRLQPVIPDFAWPWPVRQILLPCTGRLQPEQVLRAFESGAALVCAVGCEEDNCHYLEGSKRCARRIDYLRSVLSEIGLDGQRLMLFRLPGTAVEDMAIAAGVAAPACPDLDARLTDIRARVLEVLDGLPPSPLCGVQTDKESLNTCVGARNDEY